MAKFIKFIKTIMYGEPNYESEYSRKLFIGGLNRETTNEKLKDYFEMFGEVVEAIVARSSKNKSRRFGFVTFLNSDSVNEAQKKRPHMIDGRSVETKRAFSKDQMKYIHELKRAHRQTMRNQRKHLKKLQKQQFFQPQQLLIQQQQLFIKPQQQLFQQQEQQQQNVQPQHQCIHPQQQCIHSQQQQCIHSQQQQCIHSQQLQFYQPQAQFYQPQPQFYQPQQQFYQPQPQFYQPQQQFYQQQTHIQN